LVLVNYRELFITHDHAFSFLVEHQLSELHIAAHVAEAINVLAIIIRLPVVSKLRSTIVFALLLGPGGVAEYSVSKVLGLVHLLGHLDADGFHVAALLAEATLAQCLKDLSFLGGLHTVAHHKLLSHLHCLCCLLLEVHLLVGVLM